LRFHIYQFRLTRESKRLGNRLSTSAPVTQENKAFPITYQASKRSSLDRIDVRAGAGDRRRGWLTTDGLNVPVALGRGGILANKREGDGGTPRGVFHPLRLWWRGDRLVRPRTLLPVRQIKPDDAWCETPDDRHYNQPVRLDADDSADRLTRSDHLYDVIVEIDHNTRPRISGRGSAVFIHLARDGFAPTAGCVALRGGDLLRLVARLSPRTRIVIE
jgi:L,D-peptidoglycan transpeptidase YkuD (ErfK/YbiS/YcfS/YnhG family)